MHFLGYYFEALAYYPAFKETAEKYFKFSLEVLSLERDDIQSLKHSIVTMLVNIVKVSKKSKAMTVLKPLQIDLLRIFIDICETNKNEDIFSVFIIIALKSDIAQEFSNDNELVIKMITALVKRAIKEIESPTNPKSPDFFICEIWAVFKALSKSPHFIPKHANTLDNCLVPLLSRMEGQEKTSYDDDLLEVMNEILKVCGDLPSNLLKVVKMFPQISEKYGNRVTFIIKPYSLLFEKKPQIFDDPALRADIINICTKGLNGADPSMGDLYPGETTLLVHIALMHISDKFTETEWKTILDLVCFQIFETRAKEEFYKARLLGCILVGLVYAPKVIINYLESQETFQNMIQEITSQSAIFKDTYDRKLLVLGLTSLVGQLLEVGNLDDSVLKIIAYISTNLFIQHCRDLLQAFGEVGFSFQEKYKYEIYKILQKRVQEEAGISNRPLNFPGGIMDGMQFPTPDNLTEEDDEIFSYMYSKNCQADSFKKNLKTPLDDMDEYKVFRDFMTKLSVSLSSFTLFFVGVVAHPLEHLRQD